MNRIIRSHTSPLTGANQEREEKPWRQALQPPSHEEWPPTDEATLQRTKMLIAAAIRLCGLK